MNIFSFFSGAGFLDLGFELQGHYNIVFVNEFHAPFNHIYVSAREHMGLPEPIYGHHVENVTEYIDGNHEERLDALLEAINDSKEQDLTGFIGGPPCPDFSIAGKNRGRNGENGKLSGTYIDLITRAMPDFFLFENVKGLYKTARHREFFEELKQRLRNVGYCMTEQLVNALEFGAPQDRYRIILIGFSEEAINRLHLATDNGNLLNFPWNAHKLYNLDMVKALPWPTTNPYQENVPTQEPEGIIDELTVMHWWLRNDVAHHPYRNMYFQPRAGLEKFRTLEEGDVSKKSYKRLHRWRYSPTAAYGNNEVHVHPFLPRRISVAEALAIQTLPRDYVIPNDVSLTDAFKTIGNGVPYVLARGIADSLYDYINHQE